MIYFSPFIYIYIEREREFQPMASASDNCALYYKTNALINF